MKEVGVGAGFAANGFFIIDDGDDLAKQLAALGGGGDIVNVQYVFNDGGEFFDGAVGGAGLLHPGADGIDGAVEGMQAILDALQALLEGIQVVDIALEQVVQAGLLFEQCVAIGKMALKGGLQEGIVFLGGVAKFLERIHVDGVLLQPVAQCIQDGLFDGLAVVAHGGAAVGGAVELGLLASGCGHDGWLVRARRVRGR